MQDKEKTMLSSLMAQIEELWGHFDELFGSLGPDDWSRQHGPDWTFADVPYHLVYFDRDLIAQGIERGPQVPSEEQRVMRTQRELNDWNAAKFAERPAGQTLEQSLEQMRASREALRRVVATMSDADLDRPVWFPLTGCGWLTAQWVLLACIAHNWSEFIQLRYHMNRTTPVPSDGITHAALGLLVGFFPAGLDRAQAAKTRFTTVMEFTGPGGGAWTIRVAEGACTLTEERAAPADLVMSQSPETFELIRVGKLDPMAAMQSGELKVEGMQHMATFGMLFPTPTLDTVIEPMSPGALG